MHDRQRRASARSRSAGRGAGVDGAAGRRFGGAVERDLRPHRRADRGAPHDAGLREHAPHGRARRAQPGGARRRGARRRAPRLAVEGPPAAHRAAAEGRRDARDRRDGVARAGHRRRHRRPRRADRIAARGDDVPAAHRPLRPRARADVARAAVRHEPRRAGRVRGADARGARRAASTAVPAGRAARHPRAADRRRVRDARVARGRAVRPVPHGDAVRVADTRGLRRRRRDAERGAGAEPRPRAHVPASRPHRRA